MTEKPAPSARTPGRHADRLAACIAFAWPFCYLCVYLLPFDWAPAIGNDFDVLYYRYKHYLLDVLSSEYRIPLWSPGEGAGFPFYSNPFTAAFYPLNVPLALFYRIAGGYSVFDHTVFTLSGVSIFCVGLYKWLRSLETEPRSALLASLVMGTSFKVTEILRFPNAVHAAAWMPWILYGFTLASRPASVRRGMAIAALAVLLLITAGYPYYAYYLQFLVGPYLLFLFFRRTRRAFDGSEGETAFIAPWKGLLAAIAALGLPLILCSPYLLKVKFLLDQTTDRAGTSYAYSTAHEWGLPDTLGSFVYPPAAMAEGWYYFGLPSLMIILLYLSAGFPDTGNRRRERTFLAMILAWFLLVTFTTFGRQSCLFDILWRWWPGFASLRVWPRLNIVLVPVFALLLSRAYLGFESALRTAPDNSRLHPRRGLVRIAVVLAVVVSVQAGFLIAGYTSRYWPRYFQPVSDQVAATLQLALQDGPGSIFAPVLAFPVTKLWFVAAAFGSALFLGLLLVRRNARPIRTDAGLWIVMVSVLLVNAVDVAPLGVRCGFRDVRAPDPAGAMCPQSVSRSVRTCAIRGSESWRHETNPDNGARPMMEVLRHDEEGLPEGAGDSDGPMQDGSLAGGCTAPFAPDSGLSLRRR